MEKVRSTVGTARAGWMVLALALCVYIATTGGSMATDIMSYEVTKGIVEHGTVAMSYDVFQMEAHRGVDGRYYAPYGLAHAVYSIPFYVIPRLVERATRLEFRRPEALTKAGFVVGSAVAAALTVWIAFFFALRLSDDLRAAVRTALVLGFGTLLWPYAKFGFSAPLATACVLAGVSGVWVGTRLNRPVALVLGGAGIGAALLVRVELGLLCLPIAAWLAMESSPDWRLAGRRGLLVGVPVVLAVLVTLYYNEIRFGNPLDNGYLRDDTAGFGPIWVGLAGLLLSPGRSVFLYSPVTGAGLAALLWLVRRDRGTALLLGGAFLVMLCFYSSLSHWDAERSYGPRYLLPVLPMLVMPLAFWSGRHEPGDRLRALLLSGIVVLSVLVQVPGVLVDFSKVGASSLVGYPSWQERRWAWSASGLTLNTRASLAAVPENTRNLVTGTRPEMKSPTAEARDFSQQFAFSLDFWWVYLFYLRVVSARVSVALGAGCLAVCALAGWSLRRACSRARQVEASGQIALSRQSGFDSR
jgi:hypothetical protein